MAPKIAVVGTSGSGKTTGARELARGLGLPHVGLGAFSGREPLFPWTIRSDLRRRRQLPRWLAARPHLRVVRLRSPQEVERYLDIEAGGPGQACGTSGSLLPRAALACARAEAGPQ